MLLISGLALLLSNSDASGRVPSEIIVVAKSRKCDLSSAGRTLRIVDFKTYAVEWAAGRPVRIIVPRAARTKCLAKIMFKLHDHGVTQAEFVDMPDTSVIEAAPSRSR
ncbi:hypothetical protein [Sphingomonas sp. M1A8_2b]